MFQVRVKRATSLARVIETDRIVPRTRVFSATIFFGLRSNSEQWQEYPVVDPGFRAESLRFDRRSGDSFP